MNDAVFSGIGSAAHLNVALNEAKKWCNSYFKEHLPYLECMDMSAFAYAVDDSIPGTMVPDANRPGLIKISLRNIESIARNWPYGCEPVEIDIESMFVHEMVEEGVAVFSGLAPSGDVAHKIARRIENINRTMRGMHPWPL